MPSLKKLPQPKPHQFQFVVKGPRVNGKNPSAKSVSEIVLNWIKNDTAPKGWEVKVIIWDGAKGREVSSIDKTHRGAILRSVLLEGLQRTKLRIKSMGNSQ